MSSISSPMHYHNKADDANKASSVVNPTKDDESAQSMKAPSLSETSSSGLGNLPGTFPRDPHVPLDRLNDHAGATDSAHNGSLYDAARDDVRYAFGVAAQYLPQSVVGALGAVLPTGTTNAHDVKKQPDSTEASRDSSAGKAKKSLFDPKDTAVAGITSEFHPSSSSHRETSASSDAQIRTSSAGMHAGADDPLKQGLNETYAPANFASDSSIDKSSIAPDAMPPPDAGKEDRSNDDEKKPAFVTYAPAPVVTDSKPSPGAENTVPTTQQHTAPGVAQALDSTAKKDASADRSGSTPPRTSVDLSSGGKDKASNDHPPFAKYAPAPVITDSPSPQTASNRGGVPSQKDVNYEEDLSGNPAFASYAPAPGITDSQSSARATDKSPRSTPSENEGSRGNEAQRPDNGETDADSKRKRAAEAAALGAGIGTLGGATYEHSRTPAKGSSANGSHDPFDKTNKGVFSSSSDAPQGRGKSVSGTGLSGPMTSARDGRDDAPVASATGESEPFNGPKHAVAAPGGGVPTPRKNDESDNQADTAQDSESEKARHRREKEAAAAAASAELAHKRHQKEEEKKQEKAENQAKEREKHVKKHEKEVAAASAAAEKEQRHTEKANQKEQNRLEKEAHEREKAAKMHEKDIAAAAVSVDKRQDGEQASRGTETRRPASDSSTAAASGPIAEEGDNKSSGIKDKDQSMNDGKEPHEIAAAALAAAAADREQKRHPNEEGDFRDSALDSKRTSTIDKTGDLSSGGGSTRPGPNAFARSGTKDSIDPAKSGTDSDFPLEHADGGGASRVPAVDLDGKGRGATDSSAPRKIASKQPEHDRSRYHGTEGVQEKHDGGALKSSTIDKNVGKSSEGDQSDTDHDNGKGERGFVKHMVDKMKDKFHH